MSSFWNSIRSRKNSSCAGDSEDIKPPSGRSSKSSFRLSKTTNDELQRQDSDEKAGKGCIQMSCLGGQGLSCKTLNSKLQKVQKTGSSRSVSKNDVPPTPVPTPEPVTNDYPGLPARPPIPESPKPKIKGFKKRAASASPSRFQKEKRKMFRGLSKERLIAPLPAPLRNLFLSRHSQSKPDIPLDTGFPIKPLRKPGPLGRSWVKVFSDIPFVDDTSEENYPILGHTGYPAKLPEAEPLPKPPTPPPQRVKIYDVVLEDIKPQKDALIKDQIQDVSRAAAEEPQLIGQHETQQQSVIDSEKIEQNNKIKSSIIETVHKPEGSHEATEITKKSTLKMERPSRNREAVRHEAKRVKRSGTPIGVEAQLPSPEEVAAAQRNICKSADISSDEISIDEYILSQNVSPPKPPRGAGAKIDEKMVSQLENTPKNIDNIDMIVNGNKYDILHSTIEHLEDGKCIPGRPKRGNKIYENLKNKTSPKSTTDELSITTNREPTQLMGDMKINEDNTIISDIDSVMIEPPPKPKRSPKVYENVNTSQNTVELPNNLTDNATSINTIILNNNPSKPCRGNKVHRNDTSNEIDSQNKENIDSKINAKDKSPYSTVCKDRYSKELKEIIQCSNIPPPIPPKKKDIKYIDNTPLYLPLSPVSPKTRSADTSPSRPKRKRLVAQINKPSSPARPNRSTKVYTELQIIRTSNIEKHKENINENNTNNTIITKNIISSRQFRQSCPLPAPPRPKKSPVIQRQKKSQPLPHDKENSPIIISTESVDCVPGKINNTLIKSKITRRNRPPPPPPPNLKGKLHGIQSPKMSSNDTIVHSESHIPNLATQSTQLDSLKLNNEIDMNLKNIDQSFETLDSVIHSLKSYVTLPPAWAPETTKRRLSCDVVCDQGAEICHSINQNVSVVSDVNLFHNSDSISHDQFVNVNLDENAFAAFEIAEKYNNLNGKIDSKSMETVNLNYTENECDIIEMCPKVEFRVSTPSIISVPHKNVPGNSSDNELSCTLNIEPISLDTVNQSESRVTVDAASSKPCGSDCFTLTQERDTTHIHTDQEYDSNSDILGQYEGEIKAISKELNVLKSTLERCESEYSDGIPPRNEEVIVGTLIIERPGTENESFVHVRITNTQETKVIDIQEQLPEAQLVLPSVKVENYDSNITSSIIKLENLDITTCEKQENIISKETDQIAYSFQENLHRNRKSSPENKSNYEHFPDAALAMERVLESVTKKSATNDRKNPIYLEEQEDNCNQINKEGLQIYENSTNSRQETSSSKFAANIDFSTTNDIMELHDFDSEIEESDCHMPNIDSAKDQEQIDDDSSEEVSEASSCTVEEIKMRSERGREQHPDDSHKCESITEEGNVNNETNDTMESCIRLTDEETAKTLNADDGIVTCEQALQISSSYEGEDDEIESILKDRPSTSQLLHGVADITGKLEGIRSQLEAVVSNYVPQTGANDSSFDYTSSESPSSSLSNRSSLNYDPADTSSNASFYSLSQPSLSNYSILSYYTARSGPSPALSDSSINTPAGGSVRAESDDYTEPDIDDHTC